MTTLRKPRIAVQGERGSYSHIAASHIFSKDIELIEKEQFSEVFTALETRNVEYIVVPIENSTHGSVYQNYDNVTKYGFPIVGELYLKIHFHVIAHPGVTIDMIDKLYTHPVAMSQIKSFLHGHPQIKAVEYPDTAGAVHMIKEKELRNAAAAASKFAAEIAGMQVLQEHIEENKKNYTRFFVLTQSETLKSTDGPKNPTSKQKTTIQFQLGAESGSLYKSLRCFADRDIALSKIESRPILHTDWEYRFYLDIEAGQDEERLQNSFRELRDYVEGLQVLGTYDKGEYIDT